MAKRRVDVAVVVPDASPILTLARIGRLDLLLTFAVPIRIVDQVHYEVTRQENDPRGEIADFLHRNGNRIEIVETLVGLGFKTQRERGLKMRSKDLGEQAVDEYAVRLRRSGKATFIPLVLFEDPDVLELRIADMAGIYLLNTAAWLFGLYQAGVLPEGLELIDKVNQHRATPMELIDREARTKKVHAAWRRRIKRADPS
ncbi:MAG: hypothetical protein ACKVP7_16945 [Hyphomicrobiaceae bacterium]